MFMNKLLSMQFSSLYHYTVANMLKTEYFFATNVVFVWFCHLGDVSQRRRSRSLQCSPLLSAPPPVNLDYDTQRRSSESDTHHDTVLSRCVHAWCDVV